MVKHDVRLRVKRAQKRTTVSNLALAEAEGLIRPAQLEPEIEYLFRHNLIQTATYNSLLKQDRIKLHRAIGETLEEMYSHRTEEISESLAYHFDHGGDARKALAYYTTAGDRAFKQYALTEAMNHYNRAIELAHESSTYRVKKLLHLFGRKGRALELMSDYPAALENYAGALHLGNILNAPTLSLLGLIGQTIIRATVNPSQDSAAALISGEQALELARQTGDRAAEARALWALQLVYTYSPSADMQVAVSYGKQALELARQEELEEQTAYALTDLVMNHTFMGQPAEAMTFGHEAIPLWRKLGNQAMLGGLLRALSTNMVFIGEPAKGLPIAQEAVQVYGSIGNDEGLCFANCILALGSLFTGRLGQALAAARHGADIATRSRGKINVPNAIAVMAQVYANIGAYDLARQYADQALDLLRHNPGPVSRQASLTWTYLTRVEILLGDAEKLALAYEGLQSVMKAAPPFVRGIEPEILLFHHDYEGAVAGYDAMLTSMNAKGIHTFLSEFKLKQGHALLALGRVDEAYANYIEGLNHAVEYNAKLMQRGLLAALANIETQRGNLDEAAKWKHEGREVIEAMVATLDDPDIREAFLAAPINQTLVAG